MQPLAMVIASGCISHRKLLRWSVHHAAFFCMALFTLNQVYRRLGTKAGLAKRHL